MIQFHIFLHRPQDINPEASLFLPFFVASVDEFFTSSCNINNNKTNLISKYMCKEGSTKVKTEIFLALGGAYDIKTLTITANIEFSEWERVRERERSRAQY